jgi:hypothetical protein
MWWDMKAHLYTMLMLSQQWLYVEIAFAFIHSLEDLTPISCGVPELASKQLHSIQMKVAFAEKVYQPSSFYYIYF